jgi:hypothetical protein
MTLDDALANEYRHGIATLETGEMLGGLEDYASGSWRPERGSSDLGGERK